MSTSGTSTPTAHAAVRLEKVLKSGWGINMHLVRLDGSGAGGAPKLLVYSPTWLGEETFARIEEHGDPALILAPNHFHHLALPRFRDRYPSATVVASTVAQRRLRQKGHAGLASPADVAAELPKGFSLITCEGVKSGEVWLRVPDQDASRLFVGDAFFDIQREVRGLLGLVLRLTKTVPGLSIGATWPLLQLADKRAYVAWATSFLSEARPRRISFAHGEDIEDADLASRLIGLIQERLT